MSKLCELTGKRPQTGITSAMLITKLKEDFSQILRKFLLKAKN